jgi:ribosomal protein S18 acetylase RimI-like enzyme
MPELMLRAGVERDVDAVIEFWSFAGENAGRPRDHRAAVERLIARDPGALVVAEHGITIVGTVIAGWDGWRAHLYRLAVHPDYRRRGIGQTLLHAAATRLRDLGAERLDAMVNDGNGLGQLIWSADGFQRQDDWRRWVKPAAGG